MSNGIHTGLESIDTEALTPLVRQSLGSQTATVMNYDRQEILGGGMAEGVCPSQEALATRVRS